MSEQVDDGPVFGTFDALKEYAETRVSLFRLQFIRITAKLTGYFVWLIITLVLVSLLVIFLGVLTGFWFSSLTGSYISGFAMAAGLMLLLIILITLLRKTLFVNPVIRGIIRRLAEEEKNKESHG